jgi:hypothetical protein
MVKAQQFSTVEYYFDTDPGYGNGSHTTITGSAIDADISFTISALTTGMHILYTRVKDNAGHWGTTYQKNIFINNGSAGASSITTAEYFFDTDPGFGNGTQITLSGAMIDADVNFNMGSLTAGSHTLYLRLKNNSGAWSTVYQSNLFVNSGNAGSAMLTGAEYYFDTDPGVGHATTIVLNSNNLLDSSLKLNTAGLANGIHTLVIRLKNNNNAWSTSYANDVAVYSGIDSIPSITSLEVFNDTDRGIGNNINITLNKKMLLDTTVNIFVPDNATDNSVLGLRLHNQAGQIGEVALKDISLCRLYRPKGGFRTTRFGNSYTFVDTSKYNTSRQIEWQVDHVTDTIFTNSPVFNYTMPSGFHGTKIITQITGTGCRRDTISHDVITQTIEYVSPNGGAYRNDIVLNIFGGDLDTTTTVWLQKASRIVYPYDKTQYEHKMLAVIFDFHDLDLIDPYPSLNDLYDLHIHNANGVDTVLSKGISIYNTNACRVANSLADDLRRRNCGDPNITNDQVLESSLTGPQTIRVGVWNNYTLHLTNNGLNMAKEFPYWLMIPAQNDVQFDLSFENPHPFGDSLSIDSLPPLYIPYDTVVAGVHLQYKIFGFYFPFLSPGESRDITFKIRSTEAGPNGIEYWLQKSMFGSPFSYNWFNCLWDGLGYVPQTGCATSVIDFFRNHAGFGAGYKSDMSKGQLHEAYHATRTLLSGVTGVGLSCGGFTAASKAAGAAGKTLKAINYVEGKADKINGTLNNKGLTENSCVDLLYAGLHKPLDITTLFSDDPNNITGNTQHDTSLHWIDNFAPQSYTVSFENKPTASAPAQHVMITDTLDATKFNLKTFSFTGYRISDSSYMVPQFRKQVMQTKGIVNRNNMQVEFIASFDTLTGIVRTDFYSMDSAGVRPIPETSIDGFLPPNTNGTIGTGSVSYQVSARDLNTGIVFTNKANIFFDRNAPILTNSWTNTVDTTAPVGRIYKSEPVNDSTVRLFMEHSDVGSGFQYNQLFVKVQGDSLFRHVADIGRDTLNFVGYPNQVYQFYTRAIDNVNNRQYKDSAADITVVLADPLSLKLLSFTAKMAGKITQLDWVTTNEINTDKFDVERSADGIHFTRINSVKANNRSGNNKYISFDNDPQQGNNYYRLKQFDLDAKFTYSNVVRLYYGSNGFISVAPNPATDHVDILTTGKISDLVLLDASGKKVKQFTTSASNRYSLSGIAKGLYFLRVMIDSELQTFKLVIE